MESKQDLMKERFKQSFLKVAAYTLSAERNWRAIANHNGIKRSIEADSLKLLRVERVNDESGTSLVIYCNRPEEDKEPFDIIKKCNASEEYFSGEFHYSIYVNEEEDEGITDMLNYMGINDIVSTKEPDQLKIYEDITRGIFDNYYYKKFSNNKDITFVTEKYPIVEINGEYYEAIKGNSMQIQKTEFGKVVSSINEFDIDDNYIELYNKNSNITFKQKNNSNIYIQYDEEGRIKYVLNVVNNNINNFLTYNYSDDGKLLNKTIQSSELNDEPKIDSTYEYIDNNVVETMIDNNGFIIKHVKDIDSDRVLKTTIAENENVDLILNINNEYVDNDEDGYTKSIYLNGKLLRKLEYKHVLDTDIIINGYNYDENLEENKYLSIIDDEDKNNIKYLQFAVISK